VQGHLNEIIDYTERLTRAAVRELPDGTYEFEDDPGRISGWSTLRRADELIGF
jgi:N-methylhydantoinase B/oxoprolinase/acetone carboxylase alpha subunit